ALAAGYVARKALTFAWTQTTGKEPPTDPESLEVGLGAALGWAVLTGVGMEVAGVLAVRAAHRRLLPAHRGAGPILAAGGPRPAAPARPRQPPRPSARRTFFPVFPTALFPAPAFSTAAGARSARIARASARVAVRLSAPPATAPVR